MAANQHLIDYTSFPFHRHTVCLFLAKQLLYALHPADTQGVQTNTVEEARSLHISAALLTHWERITTFALVGTIIG